MNLGSLLKPVLQPVLNEALPAAKNDLKSLILGKLPSNLSTEQQLILSLAFSALDSWNIRL